jgi:DNA/RNA-binding domain of Phe-tRNA-synthetase-like protein
MLLVSDTWEAAYPGAVVGVLAMRAVANPDHHPGLDERKANLEDQLRMRFHGCTRAEIMTLPSITPYAAYYNRFRKTYHVQLQLESVALKGKPIPKVAALVEAMFMAELKNHLLTAGHDLEAIQGTIRLDVAKGDESFRMLNGQEQTLKAGDMMISDVEGVISSIIYGPDQRTRITPETQHVLFTVYAPPGIGAQRMAEHLDDLQDNVLVIAPDAGVIVKKIYAAGQG